MRFLLGSLFTLMSLPVASLWAGSPVVGIIKAQGEFRIDHATVSGNSSVFEGSVVETGLARSEMVLRQGGTVLLTAISRGQVFSDRLVLEQGVAELRNTNRYAVETRSLRITAEDLPARVQVGLAGGNKVRVTAESGTAGVRNGQGTLVARVPPGSAMEFTPQSAKQPVFQGTGVVVKSQGKYWLTEQTTNITVELRGENLEQFVGKLVTLEGKVISPVPPPEGTSMVVEVQSMNTQKAGAAGVPVAAGASSGGIGVGTVAIIGGVATAATVGGLAAAGVIGSSSESPASR